jgi:hypothetical protein
MGARRFRCWLPSGMADHMVPRAEWSAVLSLASLTQAYWEPLESLAELPTRALVADVAAHSTGRCPLAHPHQHLRQFGETVDNEIEPAHFPGHAEPHAFGARPAADANLVSLSPAGSELGDLVAVVP